LRPWRTNNTLARITFLPHKSGQPLRAYRPLYALPGRTWFTPLAGRARITLFALGANDSLPGFSALPRRPLRAHWTNLARVTFFAAHARLAVPAVIPALTLRTNLTIPPIVHSRHLLGDHLVNLEG
jgi:hypothetical protein